MFFSKKPKQDLKIPEHVAIIPDGNGRWAKMRGMPRSVGHSKGADCFKNIIRRASEAGIKYLTFYAFSTENWTRPKEEVDELMRLLLKLLKDAGEEFNDIDAKIRISGKLDILSPEIQNEIVSIENKTRNGRGIFVIICINYGGRDELINAVKQISSDVKKGIIGNEDINEKLISQKLYMGAVKDPDLIIRTSGEMRISNFLLWQAAYSEFYFSKVLWPDFNKKELWEAIKAYNKRDRRFGGI